MAQLDLETLAAFVDGELSAVRAQEVAAAVAQDAAAQETVEALRHSVVLLRAVFGQPAYQNVPPSVMRSFAAPVERGRLRFPASIAAAVLVAAGLLSGGYGIGRYGPKPPADFGERLLDEVADYHVVYARENEHQVEVPADRQAHVEEWFGAVLHRKLRIPDLSRRGLTFTGGRLLVVDGTPVAQLLYRWPGRQHEPFGLCISFGPSKERDLTSDAREGLQQVLWQRHGYTYVVVGWISQAFLADVAAEVRAELDPTS